MTEIIANGTRLAYELRGDRSNPVVMLIHGLGTPMSGWPEGIIERLVDAGLCVLRFDNRDIGRSQLFNDLAIPNVPLAMLKSKLGLNVNAPYQLTHMANDAIGLLDALSIEKAHVVGVSMGGMIAQLMAINSPSRLLSLTSIMSTSGSRWIPGPSLAVSKHLTSKPASSAIEDIKAYHIKSWQLIASPAYPTALSRLQKDVDEHMARGMTSGGTLRQMLAILAAPSRVAALRSVTVPSQVIHGEDDPLVHVKGGISTANAIPNAAFHLVQGMGHDLPAGLYESISRLLINHIIKHHGQSLASVKTSCKEA